MESRKHVVENKIHLNCVHRSILEHAYLVKKIYIKLTNASLYFNVEELKFMVFSHLTLYSIYTGFIMCKQKGSRSVDNIHAV
jgi:hypothetical protein